MKGIPRTGRGGSRSRGKPALPKQVIPEEKFPWLMDLKRKIEERKKEFPPFRENPEEDVRLGIQTFVVLAIVLAGGLLIYFLIR